MSMYNSRIVYDPSFDEPSICPDKEKDCENCIFDCSGDDE